MEQEGIYAKKAPTTRTKTLRFDRLVEEMVLAMTQCFAEALKDYTDKHDTSSKKRLMKLYAAQTPDPAKEEIEYTKQSNCHI